MLDEIAELQATLADRPSQLVRPVAALGQVGERSLSSIRSGVENSIDLASGNDSPFRY